MAKTYPNSGSLPKALDKYLKKLEKKKPRVFTKSNQYQVQVIIQIGAERFGALGVWQGVQDPLDPHPHGISLPY